MNSHTYPCSPRQLVFRASALLLAATMLGACARRPIIVQAPPSAPAPTATIITTPAPAPAPQPVLGMTGREVVVLKEAPPPPRAETPPPPPSDSYVWVPGYWSVNSGRQEWVAGHYEMPPRPTATWVAPRWERRGEGYVFIDGYWK